MNRHNANQLSVVFNNKYLSKIQPHLVKLKIKTVNLLVSSQKLLSKPYTRFVFVAILIILVSAVDTFAARNLMNVVSDVWSFFYNDVRFALYVIGFPVGIIGLICSKNPDRKKLYFFITLCASFFAFFPTFLKILTGFFLKLN